MAIDFFLVPNTLASKKGYIAQTVHQPTVGSEALVRRMAGANTTLSTPDVRGVLSLLEETVLKLLLEGHRVEIGDMLRLTPMVSGVLEGKGLREVGNKPGVRVTCGVLPGFAKRFGSAARLVRRRATRRRPSLNSLEGTPGEGEGLHAVYPNTLRGHHLKIQGLALSGLVLVMLLILPLFEGILHTDKNMTSLDKAGVDSPEIIHAVLTDWGEQGRIQQVWLHATWGLVFPVLYFFFIGFLLSWFAKRGFRPDSKMQKMNLCALVAVIYIMENISLILLIIIYPESALVLGFIKTVLTFMKYFIFGPAILLGLLISIIFAVKNRFRIQE